ncbi:BamA/TamA family outer membrane protein [Hyalangium sp. s54d21]|uniref:BamA/TamA family outer membrane protein n=2 Tax=Hyalangium rubrum TaxID=3103134 RepID=A0ABU5HFX8_9BACT|nr:BamA/TamA family outer membrane protein [Hyalangium sp. s54d21]MDY7232059.1 BamA/TamA family outer membrane protein [Hyalangium sp. s54d21]
MATAPEPEAPTPAAGYEESLLAWGLAQHGSELERSPEGKRLEAVLVAAEDVVAQSDPYPNILNVFHVRTREEVIRREVLLEPGALYSPALAEETARNLRKLNIFAVVRVVPVKGQTPGGVALLVITKDIWSLRLSQDFELVGSFVRYLRLQGTEANFLGLNQRLALDFLLRPDTLSFGQTYINRRVGGSRWYLGETASLILGRESGKPEGSRGTLVLQRPLYSLSTPWGASTSVTWNTATTRVFRGTEVWQLPYPDGEPVPFIYVTSEVSGGASYTRSYGEYYKVNVTGGVEAYHREYAAPAAAPLDDAQREWLKENHLPHSEDATYASLSLSAFEARYEVMRGVDTYALSEDYQIGHYVVASLRYAPPAFPSAAHYAEAGAAVRYRWLYADALTTVSAAGAIRRALGTGSQWTNRRWAAEIHQVSPKVLGGRFMARGVLDVNIDDLFDRIELLGGANGLRGARQDAYSGKRLLLVNVEYRTAPVVFQTLHMGGVLFYDAGSAFDRRPKMVHSVGVGIRFLFPQFNVYPFRLDFGYVLNDTLPPVGQRFTFSGGQITEYRPSILDTPLR